jgi:FKBP-type peptidyl-prolyl cis-trans isomerase SlyD
MSEKVIGFHYTVKDPAGNLVDTSEGASPLLFLTGQGQIIPGLEKELMGLAVGEKKNIVVNAKDAYGDIIDELLITVKKSQFPEDAVLNVGDQFQVNNEPTAPVFTVKSVEGDDINLDGNHPMAGKDLHFEVEITESRNATEEEMAHGHAHGVGGHQH